MSRSPVVLAAAHGVSLSPDVSIGHLLLQTVVWMTVIVGALFGLKWIAGRSGGRRRGAMRSMNKPASRTGLRRPRPPRATLGGGLEVIGRQPIGKGQWIAVVEADGQRFLVGMSGAGFTALGELRSEETHEEEDPAAKLEAILSSHGAPLARWQPGDDADAAAAAAAVDDAGALGATVSAPVRPAAATQRRSLVERAREATVRR